MGTWAQNRLSNPKIKKNMGTKWVEFHCMEIVRIRSFFDNTGLKNSEYEHFSRSVCSWSEEV